MTTKYETMQSCWIADGMKLLECELTPSRAGDTREIIGHEYTILDPRSCWAGGSRRGKASLGYGYAELMWYLSGKDTIEMLSAYAPSYVNYTTHGRATGAYGHRWMNNPGVAARTDVGSLRSAIQLLIEKPDDRRAVVAMWDSGDIVESIRGEWKDIPCTLSLQFLIRRHRLHLITTMRSNDFWLGGIYDPFTFCQLQALVAASMGIELGAYHHRAGSFHVYEKNVPNLIKNLEEESISPSMDWRSPVPMVNEARELIDQYESSALATAEHMMRTTGDLLSALDLIPYDWNWSRTALKALHYHLTKVKA